MPDLSMKFNPAFLDDETLIRSFVIRKHEFETVMEVVRENTVAANQHVLIIGPRGIGKTTLVLRVAAEVRRDDDLSARWYPVIYGEESYGVTDAGEFWLEALFQIGEQTGEARWQEAYADLSSERDPERLERRALAQAMDFADERDRRLLFVVENLNMLVGDQLHDDDVWRLRHTLLNEPRVMLLGTATQRFEGIDNEGKALYDLFRVVDLQPLDSLHDIGALWALATDETPRPAYLRPVEILTGGNPRLIRILSEFAARTSFRELMENLVHLVDDHTEYFKHHLDALPAQERKVFVALADRWDPGTARDIADAARLDVNKVSALLIRLEKRGAVSVRKQRGRTKVYQVAERLYNIYHLMRRRGQASSRVRATVRFMTQIYEGDALIPIVGRLVDEACDLTSEQRQEHYLAYAEVLNLAEPELRRRIVAETRTRFQALPDVPYDLRERIEAETPDPYVDASLNELMQVDVQAVHSLTELKRLASAFFSLTTPECEDHVHLTALQVFEQLTILAPDDVWAWGQLGVTRLQLGHMEEALKAYDRALALDPDESTLWWLRGLAMFELDRYEEALDAYDRALKLSPKTAELLAGRGLVLFELGSYEEALEAFNRGLKLNPDDVSSWVLRGMSLFKLGRYDEAKEVLDHAIDLDPSDALSQTLLVVILSATSQSPSALSALDTLLHVPDVEDHLDDLTSLCVSLAARTDTKAVLEILARSPVAEAVEPLVVALRMDQGEEVEVAQEVEEVARDILARIQTRRDEIEADS